MSKRTTRRCWWIATSLAVIATWIPWAANSQTYSVDLETTLNGLDVKVTPLPQAGLLVMKLKNNTQEKVRCELRYDAQPQAPARSTVFVKPGKEVSDVLREQRKWFSVSVNVECRKAEGDKAE